jgi:hypothetical protein
MMNFLNKKKPVNALLKDKTELNAHYLRYYDTTRKSQKIYREKPENHAKMLKLCKSYYNNNEEFRQRKLKKMAQYRALKKAERLAM